MQTAFISTYCTWTSYGSVLQSYAFKEYLKNFDVHSTIVFDRDKEIYNGDLKFSKNARIFLRNIYSKLHQRKIRTRYEKMTDFIDERIDTIYFSSYKDVEKAELNSDLFIAGSDQIFHPQLCNPLFFLDYAPKSAKRISYAASMGKTQIDKQKQETFKRLINNFDYISVRESDNKEIISEYTDKNIEVNIDPTFLIDASEWRKFEKEYYIKEKYILVYPLYWDTKLNKKLKELKKRTGYKIIVVCSGLNKVYADKKILDAGLEEFLWLIDHAQAVVTSSFHGVAMSVIFNKNLSVIINPKLPSRIRSLLDTIELKPLEIEELFNKSIDYDTVNQNISKQHKRSYDYLYKVINDEK